MLHRHHYDLQHDILRRSTHSLSTTLILAITNSFFSIMSLLTSNKIIVPLLAQCKATQNTFAWAHCMFFADQVIQTLDIPETSSTPSYVSLERLSSLLQILQIRLFSCLMCSQLDIGFNQSKWLEKHHFLI
jgi:hypothetical protein